MAIRDDLLFFTSTSPRTILAKEGGAKDTELTIQDLVDTIRDFEDNPQNMSYKHMLNASGKESLGGGVKVGVTATLQNTQVGFEGRAGLPYIQCNITGGNLVALTAGDTEMSPIYPTAFTQVVLTSSSSATLQESADIQFSSFAGGVTIDTTSSYSGIVYPVGTQREPVNNLVDAITIATGRGFSKFYINGNITLNNSAVLNNYTFVGESIAKTLITIEASAEVYGTEFEDATITGTLDGNNILHHCAIRTLNYVEGHIHNCLLENYVITLGGSNDTTILDCWSGSPGLDVMPIINLGESGRDLGIRGWHGALLLTNKTGSDDVVIDMDSGYIIGDSTITAGTVRIRGVGSVVNNSTGSAVITDNTLSNVTVATEVWNKVSGDTTMYKMLELIWDETSGNREIINNREYFYDYATGDTVMTFILLDENGDSTMTNVYERVRI